MTAGAAAPTGGRCLRLEGRGGNAGRVCRRKAADSPGRYPRRASHVCGTGARTASGSGGLPHTEWKNVYPGYFAGGGHRWGKRRADVKWEWDDDGDEPGGGGSESRISLRVEKRWLGDDPAERPSSVELWLLRDGALWEQVILTEDDHWCRTWNGLEPGHRWQVTEPEVPEGYTVSVSRQRELFARDQLRGSGQARSLRRWGACCPRPGSSGGPQSYWRRWDFCCY